MKLRLHHLEICVKDPDPIIKVLSHQLGMTVVGYRETPKATQHVLQLADTRFLLTRRKGSLQNNNFQRPVASYNEVDDETWTHFCCGEEEDLGRDHVDSVFNMAIEVADLEGTMRRVGDVKVIQGIRKVSIGDEGMVQFAVIKSCCGNVIHTLIQKDDFNGWFLPGFTPVVVEPTKSEAKIQVSHFDHLTFACHVGETQSILDWYERVFEMRRFLTNKDDKEEEGLVIGNDVGMRLKVMQFWQCSERGLAADKDNGDWEPLKIVIAESLPNTSNTQIESFLTEHRGPGIQHVGLHTDAILPTVRALTTNGIKFRHPPPTYYTQVGQLDVIEAAGEDADTLRELGILLDDEADMFDEDLIEENKETYLMQVFTHPIFDQDTFFLEVIQRKGARGFGVGNVTALARSVNAYKELLMKEKEAVIKTDFNNN